MLVLRLTCVYNDAEIVLTHSGGWCILVCQNPDSPGHKDGQDGEDKCVEDPSQVVDLGEAIYVSYDLLNLVDDWRTFLVVTQKYDHYLKRVFRGG